jgi:putative Mg2+ transporter-C (MgtC) family protein
VLRIGASVVTGIGFLGAGAILRTGLNIQGLTTAASLWLVSSIGLAAGGGMYLISTVATVTALVCLTLLRRVEGKNWRLIKRSLIIVLQNDGLTRTEILQRLKQFGATDVTDEKYRRNQRQKRSTLQVQVRLPDEQALDQFLSRLDALEGVQQVTIRRYG